MNLTLRYGLQTALTMSGVLATLLLPDFKVEAADTASSNTEVVTVTARKVKEDIRKVPLSISVVTARQLQQAHVENLAELTRAIPNLSFSSQGGEGNQTLEIRGISSTAGTSTVAVYLDDVPITVRNLNSAGQAEPRFFDISRLEVLRGPQGTLFGASSMGGTIRYVSMPVDLYKYGGSVYGDVSAIKDGGISHTEYAFANIPIVPGKVGLRIGYEQFVDGGYVDRYDPDDVDVLLKRNVNTDHGNVIRATLLIKPTEALSITPSLLYQDVKTQDLSVLDLSLGLPQLLAEAKRVQESENDLLFIPSITANYDLGPADITSVSSYYYRKFARAVDGTYYNSGFLATSYLDDASPPVLGLNGKLDGSAIADLPSPVLYNTSTNQISEELRVASKPYEPGRFPLSWIGGLYYSQQQITEYDDEYIPGITQTVTNLYGPGVLNSVFGGPFAADEVYLSHRFYDERQYATFGDLTYHVNSRLRLSAGLRFLHAREALRRIGGDFINGGYTFEHEVSFGDATTPKFSATFDLNRNSTLYATISKGFRLGGPNEQIPVTICGVDLKAIGLASAPLNYASDKLWNYETGIKSRLLGGKLQLNADLFYIDWTGIQQSIILPTCGFGFDANVGSATSFGGETDMRYRLTEALTLGLSAGLTHATLNQGSTAVQAQKGAQVEGVPDWNATGSLEYAHAITSRIKGFLRANWSWVGKSHGTLIATDPDYNRPSYGVLGASSGIDFGKWELSVFGTNLTNDHIIIQRPNLQSVNRGYTVQPLTVGVSATTSF